MKVDKFFFFSIFHCTRDISKGDGEILLIFERHYISSRRTSIDVQQGKLMMGFEDEQVTFDLFKAMDFPPKVHSYFQFYDLGLVMAKTYRCKNSKLPLEAYFTHSLTLNSENEEFSEHLKNLEASPSYYYPSTKQKVEELDSSNSTLSRKDSPKLGIKLQEGYHTFGWRID